MNARRAARDVELKLLEDTVKAFDRAYKLTSDRYPCDIAATTDADDEVTADESLLLPRRDRHTMSTGATRLAWRIIWRLPVHRLPLCRHSVPRSKRGYEE